MYPCSTKTREVLGNPSPMPERFRETREISRGRSPREISRVEGNLEGGGDGFPNASRVLVEYGHLSSSISLQGVDQKILPRGQGRIDSGKINPSLLMMRECRLHHNSHLPRLCGNFSPSQDCRLQGELSTACLDFKPCDIWFHS